MIGFGSKLSQKNHLQARQLARTRGIAALAREFAPVTRGTRKARVSFEEVGVGLSPYPSLRIFPQDEHERLLIDRLAAMGGSVERRTELVGFRDEGDRVVAELRRADQGDETVEAANQRQLSREPAEPGEGRPCSRRRPHAVGRRGRCRQSAQT